MKPLAVVALCLAVLLIGFLLGRWSVGAAIGGNNETSFPSGDELPSNEAAVGNATVNTSQLSPSQRQMLEAFGIDADAIVITSAMVACAEAKIGASRIEEIKNGATPTMTEGAMMLACYQSN